MIFLYMEEGILNEAMDKKRPRKLNFNAPLLSTRRPAGFGHNVSDEVSVSRSNSMVEMKDSSSSNGIPFCWEQAPGKPKNLVSNINIDETAETPRPKPPPGRWRPVPKDDHDKAFHDDHRDHHDEGCDGDVDDFDDDDDDNDDVFSDAMEVLSLTEAIDIVEKAQQKFHGSSEGLKSKSLEPSDLDCLDHSDQHCPSPNFIIERFLPDATALAVASSALNNMSKTKLPYLCNYSSSGQSPSISKRSILSSPKGCGLEMLLPWRMKHKLCGVKSPIKEKSIVQPKGTTSNNTKHQKKLFSSIVAPSVDQWRCK